ncbi:MAG: efflux RND transporter periplasmic adaptor subunit [Vicinamibacterales bacterium]
MTGRRGYAWVACGLLLALGVSGCQADAERPGADAAPAPLQVGAENVLTVRRGRIVAGPLISGELRAAREATVRAEVGGSMLQVTVEEGQAVRKGALLGRIETATLDDMRQSAVSALKNAQSQLDVARREADRTAQLVAAGALAARDLEVARSNVTAAEAQVADARARLQSAQKQLGDTVLHAPIAGIVSDRPVNVGDVVSPGTALFTIIDPSSMRLEASVPSEALAALRVGAPVEFTVRGYETPFEGRIDRISPQADPSTRQVPIFVSVGNPSGRLVAGLFAEGRVLSEAAEGLIVPLNAVNTSGDAAWVLRVNGGKAEKVAVTLGLRDPRTERVQIVSGVNEGDVLLRGAAQGITPGTAVNVGTAK